MVNCEGEDEGATERSALMVSFRAEAGGDVNSCYRYGNAGREKQA